MSNPGGLQRWLLAWVLCVLTVVLSVIYVDRPVADFVDANLRHTALFRLLEQALRPLIVTIGIALVFLLGVGCWRMTGRPLPSWTRAPLLCSASVIGTLAVVLVFKHIFGRVQPHLWTGDASHVHHGVYGFFLFHGGREYTAFPSATAALSGAVFEVLWIMFPRLRFLWVLTFVVITLAVLLTNGHFVADLIAGGFLGVSMGWLTVRLQKNFPR